MGGELTLAELPLGSYVLGISPYGASYWTRTAKIRITKADGTPASFFLKVLHLVPNTPESRYQVNNYKSFAFAISCLSFLTFLLFHLLRQRCLSSSTFVPRMTALLLSEIVAADIYNIIDADMRFLFHKVTQNDVGKAMVSGEFVSMTALHDVLPQLTPAPIAWGTYAQDSNAHFFLCEFVDMSDDLPHDDTLMRLLAELHRKSTSPTGRYGFPVPTLQATVPQYTGWEDSWEIFFSKSIAIVFENEERSQGADPEVRQLCQDILTKVVPRLLRPLETGGRHIRPCLIHGDIWDGNTSSSTATDDPVIFDATSIYAHNESRFVNRFAYARAHDTSGTCPLETRAASNGR